MSTRLPSETVPGRTDPHPDHTNAVGSGKRCLLTSAVLLAAAAGLAAVALQIDGQTQELTVGVLTLAPLTASGTGDQPRTSQSGAGPPAVVVAGHEADFDAAANAKTFQVGGVLESCVSMTSAAASLRCADGAVVMVVCGDGGVWMAVCGGGHDGSSPVVRLCVGATVPSPKLGTYSASPVDSHVVVDGDFDVQHRRSDWPSRGGPLRPSPHSCRRS